nr:2116_t:CDS:1 [Entrophospora candida]
MELSQHESVIDSWKERYKFREIYGVGPWELENLNNQLEHSKKAKRQHIENKFIGFTKDKKTGFHGLCVLGFGLPNEELDERIYYEFWSRVWLSSEDEEIFNLIKSNREELASLIICGGKDQYTIEY